MIENDFDISLDTMSLDVLNVRKAGNEKERDEVYASCEYAPSLNHHFAKIKNPDDLFRQMADWKLAPGDCYHAISISNVDALTWLQAMVSVQNIGYLLLSTYAIYGKAVEWMSEMQDAGRIERIDFYLSNDIETKSPEVYPTVKKMMMSKGGRLVIFKNHSKVMAFKGAKFDALLETSANINEHIIPHFEQACLTIGKTLTESLINRFAKIWPENKTTFSEPMTY